jgi:hypothetical protein
MSLLELALEPEWYCPGVNEYGNYVDRIPSLDVIKNGIRCPCGSRKDKSYNTTAKFASHIKSKKHQEFILELNTKKLNYYEENIKLNDLVQQQRKIIAELEKKVNSMAMKRDLIEF